MSRRFAILFGLVTALLWAPSVVSAANGELTDATASQTDAMAGTTIELSVHYEAKFSALEVTATIGPLVEPMMLMAGTPRDGTWWAAVTPPAGIWEVRFTAITAQGNVPPLDGPMLTVTSTSGGSPGADAPTDVSPHSPGPSMVDESNPQPTSSPEMDGTPGMVEDAESAAAAPEIQSPTAAPSDGSGSRPAASDAAAPPPADAPADARGDAPMGTPGPNLAPGASTVAGDAGVPPPGDGAPAHETPSLSGADAGVVGTTGIDSVPPLLVAGGLLGVTVLVLVWLAFVGPRRRDDEVAVAAEPADTEGALHRRVRRRGQVSLPDDPIIAAMGLDAPRHDDATGQSSRRPRTRRPRR